MRGREQISAHNPEASMAAPKGLVPLDSSIRNKCSPGHPNLSPTGHNIPFGFTSIKVSQACQAGALIILEEIRDVFFSFCTSSSHLRCLFRYPAHISAPSSLKLSVQAFCPHPPPPYLKSLGQWQNTSKGIRFTWSGGSSDSWPKPLSPGSSLSPAPNPLSYLSPPELPAPSSLSSRHRVALTPFHKSQCAPATLPTCTPRPSHPTRPFFRSALLPSQRGSVAGQEEKGSGLPRPPQSWVSTSTPLLSGGRNLGKPSTHIFTLLFLPLLSGEGVPTTLPLRLRSPWDG